VRLQQVTYANLENFMTLGGTLDSFTALTVGLQTIRRAWQFLFALDPISQANEVPRSHNSKHFASGLLVYYELKLGHSIPYPKVYFPVRHYAANDAQIALKVASLHRELGNLSIAEGYVENIKKALSVS
jgi:DMATS type aromatic prenyltransferase